MSQDVPTFGREDLAEEDKPVWDYWARLYGRGWKPVQHDHPSRVPGCFRCDLSADESP